MARWGNVLRHRDPEPFVASIRALISHSRRAACGAIELVVASAGMLSAVSVRCSSSSGATSLSMRYTPPMFASSGLAAAKTIVVGVVDYIDHEGELVYDAGAGGEER